MSLAEVREDREDLAVPQGPVQAGVGLKYPLSVVPGTPSLSSVQERSLEPASEGLYKMRLPKN